MPCQVVSHNHPLHDAAASNIVGDCVQQVHPALVTPLHILDGQDFLFAKIQLDHRPTLIHDGAADTNPDPKRGGGDHDAGNQPCLLHKGLPQFTVQGQAVIRRRFSTLT